MNKISEQELDSLLLEKGAADVPFDGISQEVSSTQTGENSSKPPALRKPIDAVMGAVKTVGMGAAAVGAGLANLKTNQPLTELK